MTRFSRRNAGSLKIKIIRPCLSDSRKIWEVYDSICPPIEQVTHKEQQTSVLVGGDALINVIGTDA